MMNEDEGGWTGMDADADADDHGRGTHWIKAPGRNGSDRYSDLALEHPDPSPRAQASPSSTLIRTRTGRETVHRLGLTLGNAC